MPCCHGCTSSVFQLMADSELPDSWRQLGMEVIVTMSETAPAMVRKYSKFIPMLGEFIVFVTLASVVDGIL